MKLAIFLKAVGAYRPRVYYSERLHGTPATGSVLANHCKEHSFPTNLCKVESKKTVDWLNCIFTTQSRLLTPLEKKAFENIVGKGENAGHQHFLLFPQCFLSFPN